MVHTVNEGTNESSSADLDGTLIDTATDFICILQDMCREKGCAIVDADLIRTKFLRGCAMVKLVYPKLDVEDPIFLAHRQRFLDAMGQILQLSDRSI